MRSVTNLMFFFLRNHRLARFSSKGQREKVSDSFSFSLLTTRIEVFPKFVLILSYGSLLFEDSFKSVFSESVGRRIERRCVDVGLLKRRGARTLRLESIIGNHFEKKVLAFIVQSSALLIM